MKVKIKNKIIKKTISQMEMQYKRLIKKAFPKLKFNGMKWNWDVVYKHDPYTDVRFLRIYNAFVNVAKANNHPFYR